MLRSYTKTHSSRPLKDAYDNVVILSFVLLNPVEKYNLIHLMLAKRRVSLTKTNHPCAPPRAPPPNTPSPVLSYCQWPGCLQLVFIFSSTCFYCVKTTGSSDSYVQPLSLRMLRHRSFKASRAEPGHKPRADGPTLKSWTKRGTGTRIKEPDRTGTARGGAD